MFGALNLYILLICGFDLCVFPLHVQRTQAWMSTFRIGSGWINPSTSGRSTTITRAPERFLPSLSTLKFVLLLYCYAHLIV